MPHFIGIHCVCVCHGCIVVGLVGWCFSRAAVLVRCGPTALHALSCFRCDRHFQEMAAVVTHLEIFIKVRLNTVTCFPLLKWTKCSSEIEVSPSTTGTVQFVVWRLQVTALRVTAFFFLQMQTLHCNAKRVLCTNGKFCCLKIVSARLR